MACVLSCRVSPPPETAPSGALAPPPAANVDGSEGFPWLLPPPCCGLAAWRRCPECYYVHSMLHGGAWQTMLLSHPSLRPCISFLAASLALTRAPFAPFVSLGAAFVGDDPR